MICEGKEGRRAVGNDTDDGDDSTQEPPMSQRRSDGVAVCSHLTEDDSKGENVDLLVVALA